MAPRYRKVTVAIWADAKFRALSPIPPCGQGLWLYLLTARETIKIPGLIPAGKAALAESLKWSPEAFAKAFAEASVQGMVEADWEAPLVFLPNAVEHNAPESPNVVTGWRDQWAEIPDCALKLKAWQRLKAFTEGIGEGFGKAFREACRQPSPNQEQEQEQEQEKKKPCAEALPPPAPATADTSPVVAEMPCLKGQTYRITEAKVREWQESYPGIDVLREVKGLVQWARDNPAKRKTVRGAPAFFSRNLARKQDQHPNRNPHAKPERDADLLRALEDAERDLANPEFDPRHGCDGSGLRGSPPLDGAANALASSSALLPPAAREALVRGRAARELQDAAHVEPGARHGEPQAKGPVRVA